MTEEKTQEILSTQKAALVLIAMGTQNAAAVMKNFSEQEIEKVTIEIAKLKNIPAATMQGAMDEFYEMIQANQYIVSGGLEYARQVLESAWGHKKAEEVLKHVEATTEVSAFYLLQTVDDKQLINFLQNEHPQTVALILANLKPSQAASILSELSEESQSEVAYRLATMEKTSPELIYDIEMALRDQMGTVFGGSLSKAGGTAALAEILNSVNRTAEKHILEKLREIDAELSDEVDSLMFLFEDIVKLTNEAIQLIVKEVDSKTLALSLKATSKELKDKIFKNMTERAAEMLEDELQYLGPVRVRDVESAQKQILEIIHELEESGKIVITHDVKDEEIIE